MFVGIVGVLSRVLPRHLLLKASSTERFTYKCTHFRDKIIMTRENLTQEILPTIETKYFDNVYAAALMHNVIRVQISEILSTLIYELCAALKNKLGSIPYIPHTHVHSWRILAFGTFAAGNLKFLDGKVSVCYDCRQT